MQAFESSLGREAAAAFSAKQEWTVPDLLSYIIYPAEKPCLLPPSHVFQVEENWLVVDA